MIIKVKTERLNELMIRKGFTKRSLARNAKIGHATTIQVCNGERNPSPPVAKKIIDELEVEFDEVFTIEKEDQLLTKTDREQ
jgi:DNA-binding XRE family transcriptional regulator